MYRAVAVGTCAFVLLAGCSSDDEAEIYGFYGIGYVPTGRDARRLAKH